MNTAAGRTSASGTRALPARPSPHARICASALPKSSAGTACTASGSSKQIPALETIGPRGSRRNDKTRAHASQTPRGASKGDSPEIDFQKVHELLVEVAMKAGDVITSAKIAAAGVETKRSSVDLLTETDQAVEKMVSLELSRKYPLFEFIGEESSTGKQLTDKPTFVCDPIDGTTNFVHQSPVVAISLGFTYMKVPVIGVVYNPFTGQLYTGIKGQGSYVSDLKHDGKKMRLPTKQPLEPLTTLDHSVVVIEWGSERDGAQYECKRQTFASLTKSKATGGAMVHGLRSYGCASLNLCSVATGSMDLYWEGGPWIWDFCAGLVILKEAGGIVVDGNPGRWDIPADHRTILAVRPSPQGQGQRAIVKEFWTHVVGRLDYNP